MIGDDVDDAFDLDDASGGREQGRAGRIDLGSSIHGAAFAELVEESGHRGDEDPWGGLNTAQMAMHEDPPADPVSWRPVDLSTYLDGTHKPAVPTLLARTDGVCLLYPGLIHSLHGESESGKSLVAQYLAAQQIMASNHVLFIDFESDAGTVTERLLMVGATPQAIRDFFHYIRPEVDPKSVTERTAWDAMLAQSYTLAVIDGVTDSLGVFGYTTTNDEVSAWMRVLPKNIANRTGAAVAVIDHVTKAREGRGRFAIGPQSKMSGLTGAGYTVEVEEALGRGLCGVIVLRVGKDRPGYVRGESGPMRKTDRTQEAARITVDSTLNPNRPVVTVGPPRDAERIAADAQAFRFTGYMERISELLEADSEPLTGNKIDKIVSGKRTDKMQALDSLVTEGYVARQAGANRSKMHTSIKPYRQTTDRASDRYSGSGTTQSAEDAQQVVRVVPTYREGGWEPLEQVVPENQGTTGEPPGTTQICGLCHTQWPDPGRGICHRCDAGLPVPLNRSMAMS